MRSTDKENLLFEDGLNRFSCSEKKTPEWEYNTGIEVANGMAKAREERAYTFHITKEKIPRNFSGIWI